MTISLPATKEDETDQASSVGRMDEDIGFVGFASGPRSNGLAFRVEQLLERSTWQRLPPAASITIGDGALG